MKRILPILLILLMSTLFVACSASSTSPLKVVDSRSEFVLNTVVTISTYEKLNEEKWLELFSLVREVENKMSRHIDGSEVSIINAAAGVKKVFVSDETFDVIQRAIKFSKLSDGAFDITIAPILDLWDIGGGNQRVPSDEEITKALEYVNYKDVELDSVKKSVFLRKKQMAIDLGGIAKGYACDLAVNKLRDFGIENAILDFGGNIYVIGDKKSESGYTIGIRDPYTELDEPPSVLSAVMAKSEAVVSSGDYERFFVSEDKVYHHIFSTESGRPCDNGVRATTVISKSAMDSDAMSTILFITEDKYIDKLINAGHDFEYLILYSDRTMGHNFTENRGFKVNE